MQWGMVGVLGRLLPGLYKFYFQKDNSMMPNFKICIFFHLVISYFEINSAVAKDSCTKNYCCHVPCNSETKDKTNYRQQIHQNGNKLLTGNY